MSTTTQDRVNTNIITGFLGVGKTTLIQQLLKHKPAHERWAVLVNEFGEIGIDGAFYNGKPENGLFVREVPGGCMCCTSGLPMQVALNQLLNYAKPHRLLIEPTGLGHPKEVMETLYSDQYKSMLNMCATLTLVDARHLQHTKYREHATYREQLQIADLIVAAKADLYSEQESARLSDYLETLEIAHKPVEFAQQGKINPTLLSEPNSWQNPHHHPHHHHSHAELADIEATLKSQGFVSLSNKGQGFFSHGWIFSPERIFSYEQVLQALKLIQVERLKAVFITNQGAYTFNLADGELSFKQVTEAKDSRLEVIALDKQALVEIRADLESQLFQLEDTK